MMFVLMPVCFSRMQISDILCWNWFGFPDSSVDDAAPEEAATAAAAAAAAICLLAFFEFTEPGAPPAEPMRLI